MGIKEIMRSNTYTYKIGQFYRYLELCISSNCLNIMIFLRRNGFFKGRYKKIESLKGKYEGNRCFIIATGPSLTNDDILLLKDEYTFSMNAMVKKFDELNWRPTFYGIQDKGVFHILKDEIIKTDVKYVFIDEIYRKELPNNDKWFYFARDAIYNTYEAYFKHIYKAKFSEDPSVIIYDGFSITLTLIQIAAYLGFKEIYLLGCDHYKTSNGKNYFVDHGYPDPTFAEAASRMNAGYEAARKYAESHDIKIFNATRGGKLEIFPRIDLDQLFNQ